MKKLLTILMLLAASLPLWAYDFEINGFYYNKVSSGLQLTYASESYNSYSGDIVIPSTVSHDGTSYDVTQIGPEAFRNCTGLTSVTIPSTVYFIGGSAFRGCTALTEITIPNSVTQFYGGLFAFSTALESVTLPESTYELPAEIFEGCTALTEFTIPSGVKKVADDAFDYCEALTSITIPAGVTEVKAGAFDGCSALTTIIVDENNTVYDSRNNCNAIIETATNTLVAGCQSTVIPNDVTAIGIAAFNGHTGLTSITIPNSVTSIGGIAFEDCTGLTSITLGNGVTSIGNNAFDGCTGLKSLIIPNSVTSIGSKAFYGCTGMTEVTISENVALIDETTFAHCTGLTDVTIPNGVSSIGISAFEGCTGLTNLTIPNSVTSISTCAFLNCNKLSTITCNATTPPTVELSSTFENYNATVYVPSAGLALYQQDAVWSQFNLVATLELKYRITDANNKYVAVIQDASYTSYNGAVIIPSTTVIDGVTYTVTSINNNAFERCTGVTDIIIPNSVTSITQRAFYGCTGLTEIVIPDSVAWIGNYAFYGCTGLTSITIPNSVTSIGICAFYNCTGLTSITLGNSVTSIGSSAFSGCKFSNIYFDDLATLCNGVWSVLPRASAVNLYYKDELVTELVIPDSITAIGNNAFQNCTGLTSITLGNGVTSIGSSAFSGCTGLTNITISNSVTSIGSSAFHTCKFSNIYFDDIATICNGVWSALSRASAVNLYLNGELITELVIPDGITAIGNNTFQNCTGLTKVTIGNGVTSIGNSAFAGCTGLTSVTIPNSVTSIGERAFQNCTGLTKVTIGNGVTSIGRWAFLGCTGLSSIAIPNSVTSIGICAFEDCTGLTEVTIGENVATIGQSAFNGCTGLTSITIPNSVTSIGESAFWDCTGLTEIVIPDNVTSLGGYAFNGCTGLTSVTIGNSVTSIGNKAFYGCTGLTSITIPNSVTSIGGEAFYGCTGLTSVSIGNSVTSIGDRAFYQCTGLTSITLGNGVTSIGSYAFNSSKFSNIYVNDIAAICNGVWSALPRASVVNLYYKDELATELVIPDSITAIGNNAFQNCTGLTEIVIGSKVSTIGEYAFSGCTELTNITISNSITSIGKSAFKNCTISNIYFDDIAAICNGAWSALPRASAVNLYYKDELVTELVIPDSITAIGNNAFQNYTGLTKVTIGNGVTSIGGWAFLGCTGLTEITIPNSVTSIGEWGFRDCTSMTTVNFNAENCSTMGTTAGPVFANCTNFTKLNIGESVQTIPNYAFYGCTGLTEIAIPNSVSSIGGRAFWYCTELTKVTFGSGLTSIGEDAFIGCKGLTSITIPNSVTTIGEDAFNECSGLTEIIIEDGESILDLGTKSFYSLGSLNTLYLGRTLRGGRIASIYLSSLEIGNKVTSIPNSAFAICNILSGILKLPASLVSIESNAFANTGYTSCSILATEPPVVADAAALGNIKFVRVPNGSRAAYKAANVWKDLTIIEEDPEYEIEITVTKPGNISGDIIDEYFIVPQSVTKLKVYGTINNEDFKQMRTNMTSCYSIDLSDANCVALPDSAFEGKYYLTELILPNNCKSIGKAALLNCNGLDTLVIPNNVDTIGDNAFRGCTGLKSITLGNVVAIGNNAFQDCTTLKSITIPNSVTSLGESAFYNCLALQTIQLSQNLTTIKTNTFTCCEKLKEISIPGSVTSIENEAFNLCSKLENIVFEDGEKTLRLGYQVHISNYGTEQGKGLFYDCHIKTLYIGRNLSYDTSTEHGSSPFYDLNRDAWGNVYLNGEITSVTFGDKVTNIGSYLFGGNPDLKTVKLGANITSIGNYVWGTEGTIDVDYSNLQVLYNCGYVIHKTHSVNIYYKGKELTHIDVPENITTIRAEQFKNVKNLESINIPNSVKSISDNAFTGCQSLMSVAFSDSITSIGTQAFQGCTSLISISLPDTLMTIGNQAFKGCTSLTTANLSDSLKTIGNEAFYDCEALANITCPALVPPTVGTDGFEGVDNYTCILTIPGDSVRNYMLAEHWGAFIQKRKKIDVEVDTPVVDEGESESGSEGDSNNGKGHFCGGHIWYDRDWHKHHGGHHAPRRYAAAEEPVAVNGIDATIGDGLSLFIATDSVVSFLIEPEEGYAIGSVRYGGVDVTNQLNNGVFTTSAVSANTTLEVSFVEGDAPVVTVMLGDANNDAVVNVSDAVVIVNYILGDESAVASLVNADANEDGVINVADVVSTVNIILSQGVQAAPMRYEGGKGLLAINDLVIAHGETAGIEVSLDNEVPYTAFQVDVTLPDGLTVNDIALSNRLNATHSMMWRMQDDNTLRVVVFALDNTAVADNSGALFTIEVTADAAFEGGNIVADNAIFTVRDLTIHHLDTAVAGAKNTAGIDGTYTTDRIYTMGRTIVIESTCDQVAYITTTGGVMRAEEVKAGRNEITLSQQGLYIVVVGSETQKVIIR